MIVFLKLGGSLITDKRREESPRPAVIRRLAQEIRRARQARPDLRLVLGHGSGSFGHFAARRTRLLAREGFHAVAYAEVAAAAARLNRLVADTLVDEGVPAVSVPPSASARCSDGRLEELAVAPIRALLAGGAVPLVHGDVALDDTKGATIVSTEDVFTYLAGYLKPARIILAGDVDGVFTADPGRQPDAEPIREITPATFAEMARGLGASANIDVTGGMLSKVRTMVNLVAAQPALEVHVVSGLTPGNIERLLVTGRVEGGTAIRAATPLNE